MKEIKIERKEYDIVYKAVDGTKFKDKEECEKYEASARGVLMSKFRKLVVKEGTEYSLFNMGSDEDMVYVVKVSSQEDKDIIFQLYLLDNEKWLKCDSCEQYKIDIEQKIDKALNTENDLLLVGESYEHTIYIITTLSEILDSIKVKDM